MVFDLDQACHQSIDPPDAPSLQVVTAIKTGRRGRPPKSIDPTFLRHALQMRGPTAIARLLKCSTRHVRRQALRYGFVNPGPPVLVYVRNRDGSTTRLHRSVTAPVSTLTDHQLDALLAHILTVFPHFGRRMIRGHLAALGHRVPDTRIRESFLRVHGAPPVFGSRNRIVRKQYQVPGPNSLVHHDGQHGAPTPFLSLLSSTLIRFAPDLPTGLIRWKFVTHCFVDGHSRFVTGIHVHTNNRGETVLTLFLDTVRRHGVPSRVRGDHGTENIRVAEWMERVRGLNRGSYIWGRSVMCLCPFHCCPFPCRG